MLSCISPSTICCALHAVYSRHYEGPLKVCHGPRAPIRFEFAKQAPVCPARVSLAFSRLSTTQTPQTALRFSQSDIATILRTIAEDDDRRSIAARGIGASPSIRSALFESSSHRLPHSMRSSSSLGFWHADREQCAWSSRSDV